MEFKNNLNKPRVGRTDNLLLSKARNPAALAVVNTIAKEENRTCPQIAERLIVSAGQSRARRIRAAKAFKNLIGRVCGKNAKVRLSKND